MKEMFVVRNVGTTRIDLSNLFGVFFRSWGGDAKEGGNNQRTSDDQKIFLAFSVSRQSR